MSYKLVTKDAFWTIFGKIASAIGGYIIVSLISPYLGTLRYGDYTTILKYFAVWSALADFGIYVLALKKIGKVKQKVKDGLLPKEEINTYYGKFFATRIFMIGVVYAVALLIAYTIPAYTSNPYLVWGLPLGMIFSSSFILAGTLQLPIQLKYKMEHLTIGLVLARIVQILIVLLGIYVRFPSINFSGDSIHLAPFLVILLSVVGSGVTQGLYVFLVGQKYIKLKWDFDRDFIKTTIKDNWKYGTAYYFSSFHTLMVMVALSWFYPTIEGFAYAGIYGLALKLLEMLLIVPGALGNSVMHKIADYNKERKCKMFGNVINAIVWLGGVFFVNFTVFSSNIINFVGGKDYLSEFVEGGYGSDFIIPFLGVVLTLSFIKQIFNYLFVAVDKQNKLFYVNLFGVVLGALIGIPLLLKFQLMGGIIAQILLEVLFVIGCLLIAYKYDILPKVNFKDLSIVLGIVISFTVLGKYFIDVHYSDFWGFVAWAFVLNSLLLAVSFKPMKKIMKGIN